MNTLLHICCAPCANMCIETLRQEGLAVTGYWYNPNIHPFTEYRSRRNTLRDYAAAIALPLVEENEYGLRPFVREVADDIPGRCVKCYRMRFHRAAQYAAANGFDAFTSSLFISPYQQHELMRETAEQAGEEFGIRFLYRDFRPYFKQGQERARELGFYMQKYCGCMFSEEERYLKSAKIIP
ncbi:MAG: epoxyqueuosine reductase QueH [Oscillospiraceae bacterium]|nr:epoxyqueuosine reductase QueH [Oscillospiraceae bacterium]